MTDAIQAEDEHTLGDLRRSLLGARGPTLRPDQGNEAFEQHKLLASAVHRASRLDARGSDSETEAWVRYVTEHFPTGRNAPTDARLLFVEWRTRLLKDGTPGQAVLVTHGHAAAHWQRDRAGRLCINLEDMWDDFEESVGHFIEYLRTASERRAVVLHRFRERAWDIQPFTPAVGAGAGATAITASASIRPDPAGER